MYHISEVTPYHFFIQQPELILQTYDQWDPSTTPTVNTKVTKDTTLSFIQCLPYSLILLIGYLIQGTKVIYLI